MDNFCHNGREVQYAICTALVQVLDNFSGSNVSGSNCKGFLETAAGSQDSLLGETTEKSRTGHLHSKIMAIYQWTKAYYAVQAAWVTLMSSTCTQTHTRVITNCID